MGLVFFFFFWGGWCLQQALALLSAMSQSIDISLQSAMEPLKTALGKSNLLKHKDKDVRLLVAACISEVMRIVAPDAPYDDDTLKVYYCLNHRPIFHPKFLFEIWIVL